MSGHTPGKLSWIREDGFRIVIVGGKRADGSYTLEIADLYDGELVDGIANARRFVQTWNAHDKLVMACKVAYQLAIVASDWNLDEVEIDGEMMNTRDLQKQFNAAIELAKGE